MLVRALWQCHSVWWPVVCNVSEARLAALWRTPFAIRKFVRPSVCHIRGSVAPRRIQCIEILSAPHDRWCF